MNKAPTNEVYEITEEITTVNQNVGMSKNPNISYYPSVPTVSVTHPPSLPPRPTCQSPSYLSTPPVPPTIPVQYPVPYPTTGYSQANCGMYNQSAIASSGQQYAYYTVANGWVNHS